MDASDVIALVGVLFGVSGSRWVLHRSGEAAPKAGQIVVTSAQGALIVRDTVLKSALAENKRLRKRLTELAMKPAELRAEVRGSHGP